MARIYQDEMQGSAERNGARQFRLLSAAVVAIALSAAVVMTGVRNEVPPGAPPSGRGN